MPVVSMPPPPTPRERWLTRSEAARLLAGALGWFEEEWCDIASRKRFSRWKRSPFEINRQAARFILIGIYTGTRHSAILNCQWMAHKTIRYVAMNEAIRP